MGSTLYKFYTISLVTLPETIFDHQDKIKKFGIKLNPPYPSCPYSGNSPTCYVQSQFPDGWKCVYKTKIYTVTNYTNH